MRRSKILKFVEDGIGLGHHMVRQCKICTRSGDAHQVLMRYGTRTLLLPTSSFLLDLHADADQINVK